MADVSNHESLKTAAPGAIATAEVGMFGQTKPASESQVVQTIRELAALHPELRGSRIRVVAESGDLCAIELGLLAPLSHYGDVRRDSYSNMLADSSKLVADAVRALTKRHAEGEG